MFISVVIIYFKWQSTTYSITGSSMVDAKSKAKASAYNPTDFMSECVNSTRFLTTDIWS